MDMSDEPHTYELRYVGDRFAKKRLPLDVLPDLSAFRDLVVAVAKSLWLSDHPERQRLPRGFDKSMKFDLIDFTDGSAKPKIQWNYVSAEEISEDLAAEISGLIDRSMSNITHLFDAAGHDRLPNTLPAQQIMALNKFGSNLMAQEKVEFTGSRGTDGEVVYLDTSRRRDIITKVRGVYEQRYTGAGSLLTTSIDGGGHIIVDTAEYAKIQIPVPFAIVQSHYGANLGSEVQFDLRVELDKNDTFKKVLEVLDVSIVNASDAPEFLDDMKQISDLRKLSTGWLDGNGQEISQLAIQGARSVLDNAAVLAGSCGIFPTSIGGVSFEFVRDGWDYTIELLPDGQIEFYGIEIEGPEEIEPISFEGVNDRFLGKLQERIGHLKINGQ